MITQDLGPDENNARKLLHVIRQEYGELLNAIPTLCKTNLLTKIINTYVIPRLLANAPIYGMMLNMEGSIKQKVNRIMKNVEDFITQINKIHNTSRFPVFSGLKKSPKSHRLEPHLYTLHNNSTYIHLSPPNAIPHGSSIVE